MTVTVIDIRGMSTTLKNAKVDLTSRTLIVHTPDENGEQILHNFVLRNVVYYCVRKDKSEKE